MSIRRYNTRTTTGLFNGPGTYSVTTQEVEVVGSYLVRLHEQQTGAKVVDGYSAANGTLTFTALSLTASFYVIAFDNTTTGTIRNAVIADRQSAE